MTAFIFDMDGTIIDSMPTHVESWISALSEVGHQLSMEELHKNNLGNVYDVVRRILGDHLTDEQVGQIAERKEILFRRKFLNRRVLVAGLELFLDRSQQLQVPMALATNAGMDNINYILDGLSIRDYFSVIVSGFDVQRAKPDPEMFLKAGELLGFPPEDCIVFEDSANGVKAAQAAGMRVVLVKTFRKPQAYDRNPAVIRSITNYNEITPEELIAQ